MHPKCGAEERQNAFAHYLAGYFFEVTGEPSMAEPGYRNALALQPNSKLIKEKLGRTGSRRAGPERPMCCSLLKAGLRRPGKSVTIPLPIPVNGCSSQRHYPSYRQVGGYAMLNALRINGKDLSGGNSGRCGCHGSGVSL